jgi:hypothetical protein
MPQRAPTFVRESWFNESLAKPPACGHPLNICSNWHGRPAVESHLIALPEGAELPRRISEITGIHDEDMTGARAMSEVFADF